MAFASFLQPAIAPAPQTKTLGRGQGDCVARPFGYIYIMRSCALAGYTSVKGGMIRAA